MSQQEAVARPKNASIQLLRIVASVFVVACHIFMNYRVRDGEIHYGVLLVNGLALSCIPIFFMLTGFFMFRGKPFGSVIKTALLRIALPLVLTCVLLQLLTPFLLEGARTLGKLDLGAIGRAFITFKADPIVSGFYLWYVFTLLIIYFWYPLLGLVCIDERRVNRTRAYLLVLGFLATVGSQTLFGIVPSLKGKFDIPNPLGLYAIFYVVLGYEINRSREKIGLTNRQFRIIGLLLCVLGTGITYLCTVYFDIRPDGTFDHVFFENDTLGMMVAGIGVLLFFLYLDIRPAWLRKAINFLGDRTFAIYLLHWPVILRLDYSGFISDLRSRFPTLFFPICILLAFAITAGLAILAYFGKRAILSVGGRIWQALPLRLGKNDNKGNNV